MPIHSCSDKFNVLVHDNQKLNVLQVFSLVKITNNNKIFINVSMYLAHRANWGHNYEVRHCPLYLSSNRRFSTPRDLHVILFNQSQKENRPSEKKRRFACNRAVAGVKVVFAVKFNKVMGNF